jgi:hypothetical protein
MDVGLVAAETPGHHQAAEPGVFERLYFRIRIERGKQKIIIRFEWTPFTTEPGDCWLERVPRTTSIALLAARDAIIHIGIDGSGDLAIISEDILPYLIGYCRITFPTHYV